MPRVRPLTPEQAKRSLANRIAPRIDRIRQIPTNLGIRPQRVFLVWSRYSGAEIGEGHETILHEVEILPTPKVIDLSAVSLIPTSVGVLPTGEVQVRRISVARFSQDSLTGAMFPHTHEVPPQPYDFFYEICEDGRGDNPPERQRYRLSDQPHRHAGGVHWVVTLERTAKDRLRSKQTAFGELDD